MWYAIKDQIIEMHIYVKPGAKKNALVNITESELHIAIHAQPKKGEANEALIAFLAKLLKLPKNKILLLRGGKSRYKNIVIPLNDVTRKFIENPKLFFNEIYFF